MFLKPDFCNKIGISMMTSLSKLDVKKLRKIHGAINNVDDNDYKKYQLYYKFEPHQNETYIVDELKEDLELQFFDKRLNLSDITVNLINNDVYDYLSFNQRGGTNGLSLDKLAEALEQNNQNSNQESTSKSDQKMNRRTNQRSNLNTKPHNKERRNNRRNKRRNNRRDNKKNVSDNKLESIKMNLNKLKKNINKRNSNGADNENNNNNNENMSNVIRNTLNITEQINRKNKNKRNKLNRGTNKTILNKKLLNKSNQYMLKNNSKTKIKIGNALKVYFKDCNNSTGRCNLTKKELCQAIAKHYIVRGNIIAAIVTTLPNKVGDKYRDGFCHKRLMALKRGHFCLPPNIAMKNKRTLSRDEKLKYSKKLSKRECLESGGYFKELTDTEIEALQSSDQRFNTMYREFRVKLENDYLASLKKLLEILNELETQATISNTALNNISIKTREIIDAMYNSCHINYEAAILALLRSDLDSTNKQKEADNKLYQTLKDTLY